MYGAEYERCKGFVVAVEVEDSGFVVDGSGFDAKASALTGSNEFVLISLDVTVSPIYGIKKIDALNTFLSFPRFWWHFVYFWDFVCNYKIF